MDDARTAYSNFWEQEDPVATHHLHTPIVADGPRLVVLGCTDCFGRGHQHHRNFWDNSCGEALRAWTGLTDAEIISEDTVNYFALPSTPAVETSDLGASSLLTEFPHARLILLVGEPVHRLILRERSKISLEETVRAYDEFLPLFPLPDPHTLSADWYDCNPWFHQTVLQLLRRCVALALEKDRI